MKGNNMQIFLKLQKKLSGAKNYVTFIIVFPVIIVSLFLVAFNIYNILSDISNLEKTSGIFLKHYSEKCESRINECIILAESLANNSTLTPALTGNYTNAAIPQMLTELANESQSISVIDSIHIIDRDKKYVMGHDSYVSFNEFSPIYTTMQHMTITIGTTFNFLNPVRIA